MASVEITGLRKLYGDVVALSDITLTIPSGAFYTLLGPSGCGKTTLLRTIAGFHAQTSGRIAVDGAPIEALPAHKRDVAMVFQDYAVFPHLSVHDNVAFGLRQRKVDKSAIKTRVAEVLDVDQLGRLADRMELVTTGLSGKHVMETAFQRNQGLRERLIHLEDKLPHRLHEASTAYGIALYAMDRLLDTSLPPDRVEVMP